MVSIFATFLIFSTLNMLEAKDYQETLCLEILFPIHHEIHALTFLDSLAEQRETRWHATLLITANTDIHIASILQLIFEKKELKNKITVLTEEHLKKEYYAWKPDHVIGIYAKLFQVPPYDYTSWLYRVKFKNRIVQTLRPDSYFTHADYLTERMKRYT